jgi:hypothetical protein
MKNRCSILALTIGCYCCSVAQAQSGGGGVIIIPPGTSQPPFQVPTPSGSLAKYEPAGDRVFHGASLKGTWDSAELRRNAQAFQQVSGKKLAVVTWFASVYENRNLTSWRNQYAGQLDRVKQLGAVSLIKFSTQDSAFDATRTLAPLKHINVGAYDPYFEEMAETLRDFGGPVFLSINHEMNGTWYPFSQAYPGSGVTAQDYVTAWRRIVDIFRKKGADNVAFVWSPNVPDVGPVGFTSYYPGDDYVDWVGASFYSGNPVDNLSLLYRTYAAKKPIFITEWATSPEKNRFYPNFPGEGTWVRAVMAALPKAYPRIKAISWFEWNKEDGNHLLARVPDQAQAYATAIQNPRYLDDAAQVLALGAKGGAPRVQTVPQEIVLREAIVPETIKTETVKTETPKPEAPARAPLKLNLLPKGK